MPRNPGLYAAALLGLNGRQHDPKHEHGIPLRRFPQPQREGQGGGAPAGGAVAAGRAEGAIPFRILNFGFAQPGMSAHAFGSDWAQLEAGTFRFRDPLNQERRFIPLRLDDVPIMGLSPTRMVSR